MNKLLKKIYIKYCIIIIIIVICICIIYIYIMNVIKNINVYELVKYVNNINKPYILNTNIYYSTDTAYFNNLRNNWKIIRNEYINYCKYNKKNIFRARDISYGEALIDLTDIPWEILILRCYNKNTDLIKYFPETVKLISNKCISAMFSILPPGKSLPLHYGSYNGVLRYHLALIVPSDTENCYIEVNNIRKSWLASTYIYFDDTIYHHVKNNTNETRVILELDIQREFLNHRIYYLNLQLYIISKFK